MQILEQHSKSLRATLRLAALVLACAAAGGARADEFSDYLDAVRLGNAYAVSQFLAKGMDPDAVDENGNTVLMLAARDGDGATVKALLRYRPRLYSRNPAGDSALMMAALGGHLEAAQALLDAGAPVDGDGWNPLLYAAFSGHADLVSLFLTRGAKVDAKAPNGATALMLAARNGHLDVVKVLLKAGARSDYATDRGMTAESWARENGNTDIIELLHQAPPRRAD